MARNTITIKDEQNNDLVIELLLNFKIETLGKEYIAYTINDNNVSETVLVYISEIIYENGIQKIIPIKDEEKELVLSFYNDIRDAE